MTEVLNSRRTFLKTAALGGAAMIGAGAAASAQAAPKKIAESTYDFVIVGAGCGGLTCAIRAAQNGLKPILIEKMGSPAGNTVYAAGFMLGVHTKAQKAKNANADDTTEKFYEDMMTVSKGHGDKALTRYVAEHADSMMDWMQDYVGVKFIAGMKLAFPMLQRAHLPMGDVKPGGKQLANILMAKARKLGVKIQFGTKVVELLTDENTGAVTGVFARSKKGAEIIKGKLGVVLATGGYSANQALVTQYCGSAAAAMPIEYASPSMYMPMPAEFMIPHLERIVLAIAMHSGFMLSGWLEKYPSCERISASTSCPSYVLKILLYARMTSFVVSLLSCVPIIYIHLANVSPEYLLCCCGGFCPSAP